MIKDPAVSQTRQAGNIFSWMIILLLLASSIVRLYPFGNSLKTILGEVDDWGRYARLAMDIKHNGILMPAVNGDYSSPAGFLYNYFLAFCFFVFGENDIPVYIIQSILLGFSIAFIYRAFGDKMKPVTSFAFLLTLLAFALLDVNKYYTYRLISENLALFTISCFFFCFMKGTDKNNLSLLTGAAVFAGLSILIRPNIFPFGIIFVALLFYYSIKKKKVALIHTVIFTLIFCLCISLLMVRNHFVSGSWTLLPTEGISFAKDFVTLHDFSFSLYLKKMLFCFGLMSFLEPEIKTRPHWLLMWIGYFTYLFLRVKMIRRFEIWETTSHIFIFIYCGFLILVAQVSSYGFRMFIPVTFIILSFSFLAVDRFKEIK